MLLRDALHARNSGAGTSYGDQSQVSINMPDAFDLDTEVEGLRGQVGRLKQVLHMMVVVQDTLRNLATIGETGKFSCERN